MGFVGGLDLAGLREFTTAACCQAADLSAGRAPPLPEQPRCSYWVARGSIWDRCATH